MGLLENWKLKAHGIGRENPVSVSYLLVSGLVFVGVCLSFLGEPVWAQTRFCKFDSLLPEHGLSQSSVYQVVRDSEGFIWFGTDDGLNRWDGYSFRVFKHAAKDAYSLPANEVRALLIDAANRFWIGTRHGGLCRYDPEYERFERISIQGLEEGNQLSVTALFGANSEELYIGTEKGLLIRYHLKDGSHDIFDLRAKVKKNVPILCITADVHNAKQLWVGTSKQGLFRFDVQRGVFSPFALKRADGKAEKEISARDIEFRKDGPMLVSTNKGLFIVRGDKTMEQVLPDQSKPHSIADENLTALHIDRQGVLWVGTVNKGVDTQLPGTSSFEHHAYQPSNPYCISSNTVLTIYEDVQGIIWLGTQLGVSRYDRNKLRFTHIRNEAGVENSLSSNEIWSILEDSQGNLWIGTADGLNLQRKGEEGFVVYRNVPGNENSLSYNAVYSLLEDRNGYLWIGTLKGLNRYDYQKGVFVHYRHSKKDPKSISHDTVWGLAEDGEGFIWIGTGGGGLNKLDPRNGTFEHFTHQEGKPGSISSDEISTLFIDSKDRLWIGTSEAGLNLYNAASKSFRSFVHEPDNGHSLSDNYITCIYESKDGTIWVGTADGLNAYQAGEGNFTTYRVAQGLPNNTIYGMLEDKRQRLWISTNKGLSCFDRSTGSFRNYTARDGLQGNEFNADAAWKSPSEILYFGGVNGITRFDPEKIVDNPHKPPVVFTSLQVANHVMTISDDGLLPKSLNYLEELSLPYDKNSFSIEFAALNFTIPSENRYAYMLEGFDRQWINSGNRRFVSYTNLDPGSYLLKVKACNNNGVWNERGRSLTIVVEPPPWRSWWAYCLYLVVLLFVIFQFRHTRKENR